MRFWASKGLFDNLERDKNGVLYFSLKGLEQVIWIDCLRKGGMSIKKVHEYIKLLSSGEDKSNLTKRQAMIKKQLEIVREEMKRLMLIENMLEGKVEFYDEFIRLGKKPENYKCKGFDEV
ncbi:MerR family transcriptional regulator [Helicobacter sp. MIT 99-5507]|uniref:MerR family transcriptional regulator n=1 Tax=Helicobacter sp. MIT 99-5507 TaxID=152489 RepID=UPI0026B72DF8